MFCPTLFCSVIFCSPLASVVKIYLFFREVEQEVKTRHRPWLAHALVSIRYRVMSSRKLTGSTVCGSAPQKLATRERNLLVLVLSWSVRVRVDS